MELDENVFLDQFDIGSKTEAALDQIIEKNLVCFLNATILTLYQTA